MLRPYHKPYTPEQKDFVSYLRNDQDIEKTPWKEVAKRFREQFRINRGDNALQALFHRETKMIPDTDGQGRLQFDDNDEVRMIATSETTEWKALGLLSTYPDRAIGYSWVTVEDKRKVMEIGLIRQQQLDDTTGRKQKRRIEQFQPSPQK
ncbi:hypothetical protein ACHAQH_008445 [Verticillium albo-atrum]